ncbi:hypothetical protein [Niallia sp. Man26]|uniref:hypothetical protein n=1 Tax=Niallia sp. Man26 TaxID=2912824 RepID=UPI001EDA8106|nr:hypothetical protein [Niallia sp. Man26]UPO88332.1 hypothetical protein L8T27_003965 [Niallia sp. Man26]
MGNVIKKFRDKETKKVFNPGDLYEHNNAERVTFLVEKGYLEGAKEPNLEFPKHTGGSWYELSNGEKIQGKDEAIVAQKELYERGE